MSLTVEMVASVLPATLKGAATQDLVDKINNAAADPIFAEQVRQNFISYTHVLKEGKFKTEDYLSAVKYVSYKLMKLTNEESYARTFPDRYQALIAKGLSKKDISSYVSAYNGNKLVNLILEQTMVPVWVLNYDLHQRALNTQADLMENAQSELVRQQAANSLLTHLAKPKEMTAHLVVDTKETSGMNELRATLERMAAQQKELLEAGLTTAQIAGQRIIEGEAEDVTPS